MSKWMLQQRISNCENRIEESRQEIIKLQNKIESFVREKNKLSHLQEQTELYYNSKRANCEALQLTVRGRASKNAVDKSVETYSVADCNIHLNKLENMKTFISMNISKFNEMIEDLNREINSLYSTISWCKKEINNIEKEEEEQQNAGLNYM